MKDIKDRIKDAGHLLKEKRKEKKLSMENLAKEIKIISEWEKGDHYPTPEYTIALCDFFEIDANVFLGVK